MYNLDRTVDLVVKKFGTLNAIRQDVRSSQLCTYNCVYLWETMETNLLTNSLFSKMTETQGNISFVSTYKCRCREASSSLPLDFAEVPRQTFYPLFKVPFSPGLSSSNCCYERTYISLLTKRVFTQCLENVSTVSRLA